MKTWKYEKVNVIPFDKAKTLCPMKYQRNADTAWDAAAKAKHSFDQSLQGWESFIKDTFPLYDFCQSFRKAGLAGKAYMQATKAVVDDGYADRFVTLDELKPSDEVIDIQFARMKDYQNKLDILIGQSQKAA